MAKQAFTSLAGNGSLKQVEALASITRIAVKNASAGAKSQGQDTQPIEQHPNFLGPKEAWRATAADRRLHVLDHWEQMWMLCYQLSFTKKGPLQ